MIFRRGRFNLPAGRHMYRNPAQYFARRLISRIVGLVMTVVILGGLFLLSRGCS